MFSRQLLRRWPPWGRHQQNQERPRVGRNVYGRQVRLFVVRGTRREAIAQVNLFCQSAEVTSYQIMPMPLADSDRTRLSMNPGGARSWAVSMLARVLLKMDVEKPEGNSQFVELVHDSTIEGLEKKVNHALSGREVWDVQIEYDPWDKADSRWVAHLSFPMDLLTGRHLDR